MKWEIDLGTPPFKISLYSIRATGGGVSKSRPPFFGETYPQNESATDALWARVARLLGLITRVSPAR